MGNKETWSALGEFIVHVIVGTIAFFTIAGVAVLISFFVAFLEHIGVNHYLVIALTGLEYVIFGLDMLLGLYYFIRTIYLMVK